MDGMNASVWADDRGRITHGAVFLTLAFKRPVYRSSHLSSDLWLYGSAASP
ncbi:hypothetical protein PGTUg99_019565 [Puccinia graminis f. sp. tritici]|uniref:Uncharacterized protein n=1 Tax=Puccinia graminis f. sp. tritici TaxID=56615 RepID=A0A5B0NJ19_PUCGR|nr:hypothetical protein PGTUg99_019565 [Puccinia graminis f. sp. tritici]